mmetsp:Transcript_72142/g.234353  ORF Transcript_72142/g.234353 Transcript_72142/m.234353 type:complete len:202 (-) Transcript_72142:129-734(-)
MQRWRGTDPSPCARPLGPASGSRSSWGRRPTSSRPRHGSVAPRRPPRAARKLWPRPRCDDASGSIAATAARNRPWARRARPRPKDSVPPPCGCNTRTWSPRKRRAWCRSEGPAGPPGIAVQRPPQQPQISTSRVAVSATPPAEPRAAASSTATVTSMHSPRHAAARATAPVTAGGLRSGRNLTAATPRRGEAHAPPAAAAA